MLGVSAESEISYTLEGVLLGWWESEGLQRAIHKWRIYICKGRIYVVQLWQSILGAVKGEDGEEAG